jgi:hypothetical protein
MTSTDGRTPLQAVHRPQKSRSAEIGAVPRMIGTEHVRLRRSSPSKPERWRVLVLAGDGFLLVGNAGLPRWIVEHKLLR